MKKPTTKKKPVAATKVEQPATPKTVEIAPTPKIADTVPPAENKAKAEKPIAKEQETKEATAAKPAPKKAAPTRTKKVETAEDKPKQATPELPIRDRVGLTAGDIWQFLSENGATSVSTLVKSLSEEEKIIQRSIGWLAVEDKITISEVDRIETIALK